MNSDKKSAPTIWFTGRPNAGKSTVAALLQQRLRERGLDPALLDGNELRQWLSSELGFSEGDREIHVTRATTLAGLLNRHGVWTIVGIIAPFRSIRKRIREILGPNLVLVYLRCSVEVCAARDTKDLYQAALSGRIENFTGISSPYEEPVDPDLVLDTDSMSAEQSCQLVIEWLERHALLAAPAPSLDQVAGLVD